MKIEVQLGFMRIKMKSNIVSLDDLFKRLVVNAENKGPQSRSLWDATRDWTKRSSEPRVSSPSPNPAWC